jgi:gamma-glutamyltranspeptidase/glutathione hydrolase
MNTTGAVKVSAGRLALIGLACVATALLAVPPAQAAAVAIPQAEVLTASAVAVPDKYSADAAARIFKEGGNAVDAAVAIGFTLAVTYPEAGNIGGGGFMTMYIGGKPYFIDYRERAPLAATSNMYLDSKGQVIKDMSLVGYRSVAVPGTVDGMWQAQHRFGKLKWKQVLAPAIKYARDGFVVSAQSQKRRDGAAKFFGGRTNFDQYFGNMNKGTKFRQPELAKTLERIASQGVQGFYAGRTAELIAASMRKGGGLITQRDLQEYKAAWRQPIEADWNGYQIITAPPPSSGGVALVQLLKMKADLAADFKGVALNSAQYVHLIAEIEKRVFADHAQYLGDPDFYHVPVAQLLGNAYLAKRAAKVNPVKPTPTQSVHPGLDTLTLEKAAPVAEEPDTTHFSVIDKWGNAVSNTYTINGHFFGSGAVADGTGVLLNDEMDDFSAKPGVPNMFGAVGGSANAIAPGKRPLSSMTPTILTRAGKVALVIGTPGGTRIFTSIFQVLNNIYDYHMPLPAAVAAMRFHHQLLPSQTIFWEPYHPITGDLARQVEAKGYVLEGQFFSGDIEAIKINGDVPEPVADPRGRGVSRVIQ